MISVMMVNIDKIHPGSIEILNKVAFSVARSIIPGCRNDVDKTMEETFMTHSRSYGGSCGSSYQEFVLIMGLIRDEFELPINGQSI